MILKKVNSPIVCDAGGCVNEAETSVSFYGEKVDIRLCAHCLSKLRLGLAKYFKENKKDGQ